MTDEKTHAAAPHKKADVKRLAYTVYVVDPATGDNIPVGPGEEVADGVFRSVFLVNGKEADELPSELAEQIKNPSAWVQTDNK